MTTGRNKIARKFARIIAQALILTPMVASAAMAATIVQPDARVLNLGYKQGTLIKLDRPAASVFIADPKIADVQIKSPTLLYVFGTGQGETTLYALSAEDNVLFSATVAVSHNLGQIHALISSIVPDAEIKVQPMNGMIVLSGYIDRPEDAEQLVRLSQELVGPDQKIVNRLQITTPTQVNLRVKFVEMTRDVLKELGFNWELSGTNGGSGLFGIANGANVFDLVPNPLLALDPALLAARIAGANGIDVAAPGATNLINQALAGIPLNTKEFQVSNNGTNTFFGSTRLGKLNLDSSIDALEGEGFASVLAEPNLTAISGETATFLAGGEFPIPVPDDNRIVIEFKEFGVGLAFTPTVLADDRISLRVRPEVSQLSADGAISVNGISVPALTTRRAETTVELGSGQAFAIAGLLQNNIQQNVRRLPGLGNLPILGALFKSDRFRNQETELVIIVTPYLVKPTDPRRLATPLDGKVNPTDIGRYLRGETFRKQPAPAPKPAAPVVAGGAGFTLAN